MMLPIALTAAAACTLLHIWLGLRVSQVRLKQRIDVGDGGSEPMLRRMRAHANFVENALFFLALLVLLELAGAGATWLWAATITFILARLLHMFGMDRKAPNPFRGLGIGLSWAVLIGLALWAITLSYGHVGQTRARSEAPVIKV